MSEKLTVYNQFQDPIAAMKHIGKVFADSGMFGCKTEAQGQVMALVCMSEGRSPLAVIQEYHITGDGKLIKRAERMHAEFQAAGGTIKWGTSTEQLCEATFFHPIHAPSGWRASWSIEQARTAGVAGKAVWKNYPRRMLQCAVIREGIKMVCPSITSGFETEDLEGAPGFDQVEQVCTVVETQHEDQKKLEACTEKFKEVLEADVLQAIDVEKRSQKVINAFEVWQLNKADLEKYVGRILKVGHPVESEKWNESCFVEFTKVRNSIIEAGGPDHIRDKEIEAVRQFFDLDYGAVF